MKTLAPRTVLKLLLLGYVLVTAVYGLAALHEQYREAQAKARGDAEAIALLLEEHALRSVDAADQLVQRTMQLLAPSGLPREFSPTDWNTLRGLAKDMPQVAAVFLVDRNGRVRLGTVEYPFPEVDVSDREYFQAHGERDLPFFIGPAVMGKGGRNTFFSVSRPIRDAEGRFDGLVVAGINVGYFENIYRRVTPGPNGAIAFLRTDGALLLRYPFSSALLRPEAAEQIKQWLVFKDYLPYVTSGTYDIDTSAADGVPRIVAFRQVTGLPLVVLVMAAQQDVMQQMLPGILRSAGLGAAVMVFLLALTWWAFRIIASEEETRQALERANERLAEALEQAESGSRAKSNFLANMSHELRTPLNAILGFTEALRAGYLGRLNPKQDEYLENVQEAGGHLVDIIGQLLDLSRLTSGGLTLDCQPMELRHAVDAASLMVLYRAETKGVAFEVELQPSIPTVHLDPLRIRQVLINLLSNAVKFTPSGGRVLLTGRFGRDGLVIDVIDTGIGMREEDIAEALDMFGALATSPTKSHGGTGGGLPLAKALVELHGGVLCIESAPGQGTHVTVVFPPDCAVGEQGNLAASA